MFDVVRKELFDKDAIWENIIKKLSKYRWINTACDRVNIKEYKILSHGVKISAI